GIDSDGNGYVDDCHGIDVLTGSGNPMDDNNHGTHVAGTIGAVGNNLVGVTGVAWNVKILPCKLASGREGGVTQVVAFRPLRRDHASANTLRRSCDVTSRTACGRRSSRGKDLRIDR